MMNTLSRYLNFLNKLKPYNPVNEIKQILPYNLLNVIKQNLDHKINSNPIKIVFFPILYGVYLPAIFGVLVRY
jgi:hypothetical protein